MEKIQKKILHQEVTEKIRNMIFDGTLVYGQKIEEIVICKMLGVSRTPVREALRTLTIERLVNMVPQKGSYVTEYNRKDINDIYAVMGTLYGMSARLALENMKDKDLKKIENLHKKLEEHYENKDHKSYLKVNSIIHDFILNLSDNMVLNDIIESRLKMVLIFSNRSLYQPNRFEQSIKEHRDILQAFRKRDSELAGKSMEIHFNNQGIALLPLFDKSETRIATAFA